MGIQVTDNGKNRVVYVDGEALSRDMVAGLPRQLPDPRDLPRGYAANLLGTVDVHDGGCPRGGFRGRHYHAIWEVDSRLYNLLTPERVTAEALGAWEGWGATAAKWPQLVAVVRKYPRLEVRGQE